MQCESMTRLKIACVLPQDSVNANVAQRLPVGAQEDAKPFELAVKMGDRDYRLNCADDEVSCCCNCPPTLAAQASAPDRLRG